MVSISEYIFGIKGLDKLLQGALYPRTTLVIAGHPGAGKTTLATAICYSNARHNKKCLYISFQEPKAKLYRVMKNLGMDLEDLEKKGLFKFVNLPIAASCEIIADTINKLLIEYKPDIVVIDSINAVLESKKDPEKRAWLQNYLYQLSSVTNGLAVIISELPYGEEKLRIGAIEFVSDILVILKHYVRGGKLVRILEIRKVRGVPVKVTEVPFQITEGIGVRVLIPPILREIKGIRKPYKFTMPVFKDHIGEIYSDESVLIVRPSYARLIYPVFGLMDLVLTNNLKVLLVSYRYSVEDLYSILRDVLSEVFEDRGLVDRILKDHFMFEAFNPYGASIEELYMIEMELVEKYDPDVVVFHGVDLLVPEIRINPYRYYDSLVNQLYHLKSMGKLVVRVSNYINKEQFRMYASLADIVMRVFMRRAEEGLEPYVYIWRRDKMPVILRLREILNNIKDFLPKYKDLIKERISKH